MSRAIRRKINGDRGPGRFGLKKLRVAALRAQAAERERVWQGELDHHAAIRAENGRMASPSAMLGVDPKMPTLEVGPDGDVVE